MIYFAEMGCSFLFFRFITRVFVVGIFEDVIFVHGKLFPAKIETSLKHKMIQTDVYGQIFYDQNQETFSQRK